MHVEAEVLYSLTELPKSEHLLFLYITRNPFTGLSQLTPIFLLGEYKLSSAFTVIPEKNTHTKRRHAFHELEINCLYIIVYSFYWMTKLSVLSGNKLHKTVLYRTISIYKEYINKFYPQKVLTMYAKSDFLHSIVPFNKTGQYATELDKEEITI